MATILGNAYVRVRPDTTGFGSALNGGLAGPLKDVGKLLAAVSVVSVVKEIGKIGMAYEDSLNTLRAVSGATESEMAKVADTAKRLGSDTTLTATSAADAAVAMTELAKGGLTVNEAMGAARGTLQLAAAAGIEAADAAKLQSAALNAFNLEADQAGRVADVLANAANAAAGEMSDFGYALQAGGTVAAAAGVSLEDTAAALGILANNGILGSDAGTLLKSALLALQSPSSAAAAAMEELGLQAYDANGEFVGMESLFEQLQVAAEGMTDQQYAAATSTLFGADAARLAGIAATQGGEGFALMADAMEEEGTAAEVAAAKSEGLSGAIGSMVSVLETMAIEVYENVSPALEGLVRFIANDFLPVVSAIGGVIGDVIGFFVDLPTPVLAGIGVLTALMVLNGPLSTSIGNVALRLASVYGSAVAAASGAGIASAAMGGLQRAAAGALALMGGPLGLAITAVTVGIGFLASALGDSSEETQAAENFQRSLASALEETNGQITESIRALAAQEALDYDIGDNNLLGWAEELGVSLPVATDALLGNSEAQQVLRRAIENRLEALEEDTRAGGSRAAAAGEERASLLELQSAYTSLGGSLEGAVNDNRLLAEATGQTQAAVETMTFTTGLSAEALEEWRGNVQESLAGFVDPLGTYNTLVQEMATQTAASTESSEDSWSDYVGTTTVSLDEVGRQLQEQIEAQANWRTNIVLLTQRGGIEVGQHLAAMGEEGAGLVQQLVDASDEDFQRLTGLMIEQTRLGGAGAVAEMETQMAFMQLVAQAGGTATVQSMATALGVGVEEVRAIAARYNVALAEGINPILVSIGQRALRTDTNGAASGNGQMGTFAEGGYTGVGRKHEPAGVVHRGEYVLTQERTSRIGLHRLEHLEKYLPGFAGGGFVTGRDVPLPPAPGRSGPPISSAASGSMGVGYNETKKWIDDLYALHQASQAALSGGAGFGGSSSSPNGAGGLGPKAAAARAFVMRTWGITNIGGYANRNIAGTNTKSDHALGKAIDVMIANYRAPQQIALGNDIAQWFVNNPGAFGTKYVIWRDRINQGRGWQPYGHPGGGGGDTLQHRDHVHVSVYDDGGILQPGNTLVQNKSGKPEAVLNNEELENYKRLIANGGSGPLVGQLTIQVGAGADVRDGMEEAMFHLRRIKRGGGR